MKKILKWLLYTSIALIVLTILLISPIDRTALKEQPFYHAMMKRLDTLRPTPHKAKSKAKIGWSKFNITPNYSMPMAGYTPKEKFETIHDSLHCRVISINNGSGEKFLVSIDLMLFPPIVRDKVTEELKRQNKDYFVYFSATHTHSGLGGWDPSMVGRLTLGTYHSEWVDKTVNTIIAHLEKARTTSLPSSIYYWETDATEFVENRLDVANGKVDGKLRGLKFIREDSSKAIVATYSGHPTTVGLLNRIISGDYPTALTNHLEEKGFGFGMFLAGMVGSHRLKGFDGNEFERIDRTGQALSEKIVNALNQKLKDSISISSSHIPIEFGRSQLRIANDWKVRDWVFTSTIGKLRGELTVLQIGNIVLIGTPCDFSGEIFTQENLESFAEKNGKKLIITSFNGNYVGYVTADQYYEKGNEEEVMALNWTGPYFGAYYSEMIKKIVRF